MGLCRPRATPAGTSAQCPTAVRGPCPQLAAGHHQHFFIFRLDLDVDGTGNSVVEMNTAALPAGPNNPYLGDFVMQETGLHTEQEAQRQLDLASNSWVEDHRPIRQKCVARAARGLYAGAWGESRPLRRRANVSMRQRAGFLNVHLWVMPYNPVQMNAAGYYINQSKGGEEACQNPTGRSVRTSTNRAIENQDTLVRKYTMRRSLHSIRAPRLIGVVSAGQMARAAVPARYMLECRQDWQGAAQLQEE